MAEAVRFACPVCGEAVVAWSDGNPYYYGASGAKVYAYHPDHESLARCVGNDTPHLCLACGVETTVDSRAPRSACAACGEEHLVASFELEDQRRPACTTGRFVRDHDFFAVS
jgi:predicted RNA-binding Zn-ribbon protein involved in translation (DUF1610 family)